MPDLAELRFRAAGVLGQGLTESLFLTLRTERVGTEHYLRFREAGEPVIFVFWHDQLLPLAYHHRQEDVVVLVSEHADGEYISRILDRYGFLSVRGSSTRGGVKGLKGLVRAAHEGHDLAITPDGPRGPRHEFKPGALMAARLTGLPLIPVAAGASRFWRMESWDRFFLPKPLSIVRLEYGPPHRVPRDATDTEVSRKAAQLQVELSEMEARVFRAEEAE